MDGENDRILILTASFGEGHNQAATAIQQALEHLNPSVEARILDFMQWVHPKLDSFAQYCLYQSCRKAPSLYGYLYKATDRVSASNPMNRRLGRMGRSRLLTYLNQFDPSWVISTFPIPANVVSSMREAGEVSFRTATVITDLHPHSQWIHANTDHYFVASEQVRYILRRRGVPRGRIHVTGIPVRQNFANPVTAQRSTLKAAIGLDPTRQVILVTGGGAGIFPDLEYCLEMLNREFPLLQIVVICGRNKTLQDELDVLVWAADWRNVQVKGFVQNIHEYIAAADLVIGKSGGLTTSESLAMGTPMMIYRPLPGQETYNAKHLVRSGAALLAMNQNELATHLKRLEQEPDLLESMRMQALKSGKGQAANEIAVYLIGEHKQNTTIEQHA
ncbi:MAG: hypothetical protein JWN30_498 [Bacilli bacterium]|nr:hypothetical protein [Bacilli bacterium]